MSPATASAAWTDGWSVRRRSEREVPVGGSLLADLVDGVPVHPRTKFVLTRGADFKRPVLVDPTPPALVDPLDDAPGSLCPETVPLADPLDIIIAREDAAERGIARQDVRVSVQSLDPIERAVIRMRYGFDQHEQLGPGAIGERLGICRKSVYNIERRALAKLGGDGRCERACQAFAA